jgi:hypothetical protein
MSLRPRCCVSCSNGSDISARLKDVLTLGKKQEALETGVLYENLGALGEDKKMVQRPRESVPGAAVVKPRAPATVLEGSDECALCLDNLLDESGFHAGSFDVEVLTDNIDGCGHVFHAYCLYNYIASVPSYRPAECPLCKTRIPDAVVRRARGEADSLFNTNARDLARVRRMRYTFALDVVGEYDEKLVEVGARSLPAAEVEAIVNAVQLAYGYDDEEKRQALPQNASELSPDDLISALRTWTGSQLAIPMVAWAPVQPVAPPLPVAPNLPQVDGSDSPDGPPALDRAGDNNGRLYDDATETEQGRFLRIPLSDREMGRLAFDDRRAEGGPHTDPLARKAYYLINSFSTRQLLFEAMHNRMSQARMSIHPERRVVPVVAYYKDNIKKILFSAASLRLFSDDEFWRLMPTNHVLTDEETAAIYRNLITPILYENFKDTQGRKRAYAGSDGPALLETRAREYSEKRTMLVNHLTPFLTGLRLLSRPRELAVTTLKFDNAALANASLRDRLASIAALKLIGKYSRRRTAISEGSTTLNLEQLPNAPDGDA